MNPDDPIRAILLLVGATMFFSSSDTTAKYLSAHLPVVELMWIRYVLFLGMSVFLNRGRGLTALKPRNPGLQVLRGACMTGSAVLFVFGVRRLTMAEATTISFLAPLLVTILSIPILGEVVGARRWAAVGAGMLGMLIVVQPGLDGFKPAALFGLASATCWATGLIITRKIATTDAPQTTVLWTALFGALVLTTVMPFTFQWPTAREWLLALVLGTVASVGQYLVILAHRLAPASLLAPFVYTQLLWSSSWGYVVFHNVPGPGTMVGASIIIASGLYTAHRERMRYRQTLAARAAGAGG